jgi:hypothetical protein
LFGRDTGGQIASCDQGRKPKAAAHQG